MAFRYDFSAETNLGNVADPVLPNDAATKAYVDAGGGGGSGNPAVFLAGAGVPAGALGSVGNFYRQTDVTPNVIYLKTAASTWTPQPNFDGYVDSRADGRIATNVGSIQNGTVWPPTLSQPVRQYLIDYSVPFHNYTWEIYPPVGESFTSADAAILNAVSPGTISLLDASNNVIVRFATTGGPIWQEQSGLLTTISPYYTAVIGDQNVLNDNAAYFGLTVTQNASLWQFQGGASVFNGHSYSSPSQGFVFQPAPEETIINLIDEHATPEAWTGNGITGTITPSTINVGTNLVGAYSGGTLTINATGSGTGADLELRAAEKEPTGFPDASQTTISFDNATRTFTIAPVGASFDVWVAGTQFTKTAAETIQIADTSGLHYIAYNTSGQLVEQTTYFVWDSQAPVAYVYWNATDQAEYFFANERHGATMDWATHEYLHRTRGAAYASGFTISASTTGTGNLNTDAQFGMEAGTFFDEDLQIDYAGDTLPAPSSIFYRLGAAGIWKSDAATSYPYAFATTTAAYNQFDGSVWAQQNVGNNNYGVMWLCATNDPTRPIISIMGQATYNNIGDATTSNWNDLDLTGLPIFEIRPLYLLVFQTSTSYTNAVAARTRAVIDWRSATGVAMPDPTYDAIDLAFRETPETVFANDAIASSAWQTYVVNTSANSALIPTFSNFVCDGAIPAGTGIVSVLGDATTVFPQGTQIAFENVAGTYTVSTPPNFAGGLTDFNITPVIASEAANGAQINLVIATTFQDVIAGSNVSLAVANNVLTISSSSPGTGTVTSITAGTGLSGGTITTSGTIALLPPTGANIGGVKAGTNITIAADGTISAASGTITLTTTGENGPATLVGTTLNIPDGIGRAGVRAQPITEQGYVNTGVNFGSPAPDSLVYQIPVDSDVTAIFSVGDRISYSSVGADSAVINAVVLNPVTFHTTLEIDREWNSNNFSGLPIYRLESVGNAFAEVDEIDFVNFGGTYSTAGGRRVYTPTITGTGISQNWGTDSGWTVSSVSGDQLTITLPTPFTFGPAIGSTLQIAGQAQLYAVTGFIASTETTYTVTTNPAVTNAVAGQHVSRTIAANVRNVHNASGILTFSSPSVNEVDITVNTVRLGIAVTPTIDQEVAILIGSDSGDGVQLNSVLPEGVYAFTLEWAQAGPIQISPSITGASQSPLTQAQVTALNALGSTWYVVDSDGVTRATISGIQMQWSTGTGNGQATLASGVTATTISDTDAAWMLANAASFGMSVISSGPTFWVMEIAASGSGFVAFPTAFYSTVPGPFVFQPKPEDAIVDLINQYSQATSEISPNATYVTGTTPYIPTGTANGTAGINVSGVNLGSPAGFNGSITFSVPPAGITLNTGDVVLVVFEGSTTVPGWTGVGVYNSGTLQVTGVKFSRENNIPTNVSYSVQITTLESISSLLMTGNGLIGGNRPLTLNIGQNLSASWDPATETVSLSATTSVVNLESQPAVWTLFNAQTSNPAITNTAFGTFTNANEMMVSLQGSSGGTVLIPAVDYTLAGDVLTLVGITVLSGDYLYVSPVNSPRLDAVSYGTRMTLTITGGVATEGPGTYSIQGVPVLNPDGTIARNINMPLTFAGSWGVAEFANEFFAQYPIVCADVDALVPTITGSGATRVLTWPAFNSDANPDYNDQTWFDYWQFSNVSLTHIYANFVNGLLDNASWVGSLANYQHGFKGGFIGIDQDFRVNPNAVVDVLDETINPNWGAFVERVLQNTLGSLHLQYDAASTQTFDNNTPNVLTGIGIVGTNTLRKSTWTPALSIIEATERVVLSISMRLSFSSLDGYTQADGWLFFTPAVGTGYRINQASTTDVDNNTASITLTHIQELQAGDLFEITHYVGGTAGQTYSLAGGAFGPGVTQIIITELR